MDLNEKYRIKRTDSQNIAIQELKGNPAKENWETISYHGSSASSLISGVFNLIVKHTPSDTKLSEQLEKLRLELVSGVAQVEKMIREADLGN